MPFERVRTQSKTEESNITSFISSCVELKSNVSFYPASIEAPGKNILLIGTAAQLKDDSVKDLPFFCDTVVSAIDEAAPGALFSTFITVNGKTHRLAVGVVPAEASRHNAPARPDKIATLVAAALKDGTKVQSLDIFSRSSEELCVANAIARSAARSFSAKKGLAEQSYLEQGVPVRVFFPTKQLSTPAGQLEIVATNIQLCMRLLDAPTNLLDTVTFSEIAFNYASKLGLGIDIISGEDLRERGYGGVYGVGKAAEFPPALVTLSYKPKAGIDPKQKIAFVGKGVVYDTGGLAIKAPYTNMCGMKHDMGGAAAVFTGFLAAAQMGVLHQMSCTLCLADNAIGPRSQRNDDIVRMKSGLTVEINNTDAEGRLVLGDGVFHATSELDFTPDVVVEMATLTGAQSVATGKRHAAIFVDCDEWETKVLKAGRKCGDTCFPVLYCPEYHNAEFDSKVADCRNLMAQTNNAGISCAGQFIANNLAKDYKGNFVHVDLASPSCDENGGTGFGVSLIAQLFAF